MTNRSRLFACLLFLCACAVGATAHAGEATVPDTVGLSLDEARSALEKAGFAVKVKLAPGRTVGQVFSQEPGGLCKRDTGATIELTVGGPTPKPGIKREPTPREDPTPRTDDLGAPPAGAGAGAVPALPRGTDTPSREPDPVPETPSRPDTAPAPGSTTLVYKGKAIPPGSLANTNGPELPNVLNMPVRQAQRALRRWNVKVEQTLAMPELVGKVVNQVPFATSKLATSESVTIIVAIDKSAPNQVFVRQAEGKAWLRAAAQLEEMGLTVDPRSVASSAADRGKVVMQSPQAGSLATRGSSITLLVGRGPGSYSADVVGDAPSVSTPVETPPLEQPPTKDRPRVDPGPIDDGPPAGAGAPPIEPGSDAPSRDEPSKTRPPTELLPAELSPVETPPVETPPVQTPPVEAPPAKAKVTLPAPSLKGPPDSESYPYKYGADFSWSTIEGASSYEFELQEEQKSGSWTPIGSEMVNAPNHRPTKIKRGRYRWRVRALSGENKGAWSGFRRLYMY